MCEERASLGSRNENQVFMFQVQEGHSRFDFFAQTRDRRDIVGGQMSRDDEGSGGHKGVATQKVFFSKSQGSEGAAATIKGQGSKHL